jgi:LacI family transcriptional regulator
MNRTTLDDIAAQLGLSKYSVSRALSGKAGVSEQTRQVVIEAAQALGYRYRGMARASNVRATGTVALLIPHSDVDDIEFWMGVISGASDEAEALGYTFVTRPIKSVANHAPLNVAAFKGIIVAGSRARAAMQPYLEAGIPASLVTYAKPLEQHDTIHSADFEEGVAAGEYLIGIGHRSLAYVTEAPDKPSFNRRACGLEAAVRSHEGCLFTEIDIDSTRPGASFEAMYQVLRRERNAPTAILTSTDGLAYTVLWALNRLGLSVPGDVSVMGHNDRVDSTKIVPPLTTIRIATYQIGRFAMRFLHERMQGQSMIPARRLELKPELIIRDSTAPPPGGAHDCPNDPADRR